MPGGERDIPRSKWMLPTPVPPYIPQSPKDISSETGITAPLCQNLSDTQAPLPESQGYTGADAELGPGRWAAVFRESVRTHTLDN